MGLSQSKEKAKLKEQVIDFTDKFQKALIGCGQAKNTFVTLSELWSDSREDTVLTLSEIADQLDRNHFKANLANLTGSSSSIAGGTSAIASIVLAPISGGASLALAAGGLFGTVAGTATTLGANIVEVYLTKDLMAKAKEVLKVDAMYTKALSAAFHELVLHENELYEILAELHNREFQKDLHRLAKSTPHAVELDKRYKHLSDSGNAFQDMVALMSCLYPEDKIFLDRLRKTEILFCETPSLSSAVSSSSEFFQALKELSSLGPETLKGISGAAIQGSAVNSAQIATLSTQIVTVGLGAIFVALDIHHFMLTSRNYSEGSKTELSEKLRNCVTELRMEKSKVDPLANVYKAAVTISDYK